MPKYTPQDADNFIETLSDVVDNVRSYSGRGMSGKECVGVVVDDKGELFLNLWEYMIGATADEEEHLKMISLLRGSRTDSMGMRTIVYWPQLTWPEGRESNG